MARSPAPPPVPMPSRTELTLGMTMLIAVGGYTMYRTSGPLTPAVMPQIELVRVEGSPVKASDDLPARVLPDDELAAATLATGASAERTEAR